MARLWLCIGLQMACLCASVPAYAQSDLETARARYEEADFEGALTALSAAWDSNGLSRDELVELLRLRALVHLGTGDQDAMRTDVRALLVVDPDVQFDQSTPPEVQQAAEALRSEVGNIRVEAEIEPTDTGARIDAEVSGDSVGLLVRSLRVHARADGGDWQSGEPPLEVPSATEIAYRAEAIGPGGAVIAQDGTEDEPLEWSAGQSTDSGGGGVPWLWIGVGTGVAVVAGVVLVAVLAGGGGGESDVTQPSLPMALSE